MVLVDLVPRPGRDFARKLYFGQTLFWSVFRYKAKSRTLPMTLKGLGEEAVSPVDLV